MSKLFMFKKEKKTLNCCIVVCHNLLRFHIFSRRYTCLKSYKDCNTLIVQIYLSISFFPIYDHSFMKIRYRLLPANQKRKKGMRGCMEISKY